MRVCDYSQRSFAAALVLSALCCFFFQQPLFTQDFFNEASGAFVNSTGSLVRLRSREAQFRNDNSELSRVRNDGIIEFLGAENRFTGSAALGANQASRIGGLVRYAATTATQFQQVQARWYSNLALEDAAIKRIPDGVRIGGESPQTGIFTASGGFRQYSGTLYYDNRTAQILLGGEQYQNVEIARGTEPKRVTEHSTVRTRGFFRQDTSNNAGLQVYGVLSIGTDGIFPTTSLGKGNIDIGTSSSLRVENTRLAQVLINTGVLSVGIEEVRVYAGALVANSEQSRIIVQTQATVRLYSPSSSTHGTLRLPFAGNEVVIEGVLRNDFVSGTNAHFHAQSTVRYAASTSQTLMPTTSAFPYGNLTLQNSDKILLRGTVALAGTLRVESAMADIREGELLMLNPSADALYTGRSEVRGAMKRLFNRAARQYTFNNAETRFTPSTLERPSSMTLTILPQTEPAAYMPENDVRRRIRWQWEHDAQTPWVGVLRIGYRLEDISAPFQPQNERVVAMFSVLGTNAQNDRVTRLAGLGITRRAATGSVLGFVEYQGLTNAMQTPFSVRSGEEILLRGLQEPLRSVRDGRWSNPATWNLLREPDAEDSVEITHTVHVGFRRNALDGMSFGGQVRERFQDIRRDSSYRLARSIRIQNGLVHNAESDSSRHAALVIASFLRSDSTFADEAPPQFAWKLGSVSVGADDRFVGASVSDAQALSRITETSVSRQSVNRLRSTLLPVLSNLPTAERPPALVIAAFPDDSEDSSRVVLERLDNRGFTAVGGKMDVEEHFINRGFIGNVGEIRTFAAENSLTQDSVGSLVIFARDMLRNEQHIPALRYSRLALSGRAPKRTSFSVNDTVRNILIVHDSLETTSEAVWMIPPSASVQVRGGILHEGRLTNNNRDAVLWANGSQRQVLSGSGVLDELTIENPHGVVKERGIFRLQSALNLVSGEFRTTPQHSLRLLDNAVITRFPQATLIGEPIVERRVRLRTRGDGRMSATGEFVPMLSVLDVANSGGYIASRNVVVQDSLRLASRLWFETPSNSYTLDFLPRTTQPVFSQDTAEIIGVMRRMVDADSVTRLFHNRYTGLQILPLGQFGANALQATMRVMPQRFPSPNNDSSKIWRAFECSVSDTLTKTAPPLTARFSYAWRTAGEQDTSSADETNGLEAPRVLLQRWNTARAEWETAGSPLRASRRSSWNRLSEQGAWYFGVADSVMMGSLAQAAMPSPFYGLGVDSTRTVAPSLFVRANLVLEGALLPSNASVQNSTANTSAALMKTDLRVNGYLPSGILQAQIPVLADSVVSDSLGSRNIVSSRNAAKIRGVQVVNRALPLTTVDWLVLEFRPIQLFAQNTSQFLSQTQQDSAQIFLPLLLQQNGVAWNENRQSTLTLELPEAWERGGRFLVRIHHRNHLPVQWLDTLEIAPQGRWTFDWTDTAKVLGRAQALKRCSVGGRSVFSLVAGDAVDDIAGDYAITRSDYDVALQSAWNLVPKEGYVRGDVDLDGIITTRDANIIWNNLGKRRVR